MAKIEAKESRTFKVNAPIEEAYNLFADPEQQASLTSDLERYELVDDETVHYVLEEQKEKGITFQGDYTVRYTGNGTDEVEWKTLKGNIETKGRVKLRKISDDVTEIDYRESLTPDLPIPRLMAKVFKPIVAREVRKGIGEFLSSVEERLGGKA